MVRLVEAKTILGRCGTNGDPVFGLTYNMNLYRGCQHACIYCDSRSLCYRMGELSNIREKKDALQILEKEISKKRKIGTIGTGSMNDPYMPVEKDRLLVRGALEIISNYNFPVHVMTKSDLVIRDMDLLKKISKTYAAVSFTITAFDDELGKKIEPAAPTSSKRFEAIKKLSDVGIYAGVLMTPILPWITDNVENIENIIKTAKESGAQYIISWLETTQRPGQREHFYKMLDKSFPGLRKKYEHTFGDDYICSPVNIKKLREEFKKILKKYDMPSKMQFYKEKSIEQPRLF